ncbi:MAG: NTP transferase domain-containing protein, partial [Desulfovibrionaceae bacterium]
MPKIGALILAAGKGTRMHSIKPKVLQTLLGEPLLLYVVDALRPLFGGAIWTVIGHQADMVRGVFSADDMRFVEQLQQLGTGHALLQAMPALREGQCSHVLVVNGDTPLVSTALVKKFLEQAQGADLAFATLTLPEPGAYGRVVRQNGAVRAIVEAKDYDCAVYGPEPHEVNAGLYCFSMALLETLVSQLG